MLTIEKKAAEKGYRLIAGVDEAGRGPLAGPVVASAVILPIGFENKKIKDSKKLSSKQREHIYPVIISNAISVGVAMVDNFVIDEINILQANRLAMKNSILKLSHTPDMVLIDGRDNLDIDIDQLAVIKGDNLSQSIAAASIVAKVTRDRVMCNFAVEYSQYGFASHKGYGTKVHIEAIKNHGPCKIHRKSFIKKIYPV